MISFRFLVICSALACAVHANPKTSLDLVFATQQFSGTAISPDGQRLAWVEPQKNPDRTESRNSLLMVLDPGAKNPRRVTAGDGQKLHAEHSAAWSPDGTQLAFLSDPVQPKQLQLFVVPAAGGKPRALTKLVGRPAHPRWSPDGRTIALLFIEGSTRDAGATEAAARLSGDVEEKILEQRLAVVDVASGTMRLVSAADTHVYEYDWSPDSREIVFTGAKGDGDNNWWVARLQAIDVATGAVRELFKPTLQITEPRWSPDGKQIAFVHGLMSDFGVNGGDIWVVSAHGTDARNLTPQRKSSPGWLTWQHEGGKILFVERAQGSTAVGTLDPANGRVENLWRGAESITGLTVANDGETTALVRHSFTQPPEVFRGRPGAWESITKKNTALKPLWGRVENIQWKTDGFDVQGWLIWPSTVDPEKRYPLVVSVHGGPASQATPGWPTGGQLTLLAAEGYFVFVPNPRGSFGQGTAFTEANVKDFGHGDLRDLLAGVDTVLANHPIDPKRLGIGGWSYGGYMTMWTITQTDRFRAAVAGAGIANWQSYYGQNLIDQWMLPYFGASIYDDPAVYAKSSPINFIKHVRTPTLIAVGDSDAECPLPQSQEYWHALKTLGVKTKLVVYENEGHHFRVPAHTEDLLVRTVAWFDENLR